MKFYCYNKCSTCKKAKKYLDDNNIKYEYIEIKENPPKFEEIKEIILKFGKDINKIFNTSGLVYRENNYKEKLKNMTVDEKLEVLSKDGMLIKRPILLSDSFALFGFKEEEYKEKLGIN